MKFKLTVQARGHMADFAHFRVFNGHQELVAKDYEKLELSLEKGIYQVEMELNQTTETEIIRLTKDTAKIMEIEKAYSSIPVAGYNSSFEYYSDNAVKWSNEKTVDQSTTPDSSGSVFLFFRYPDEDIRQYKEGKNSLGENFKLLNPNRQIIYSLQGKEVKEDLRYGWMAFHAELSMGQYFLVYEGDEPREIPLYVYEDWQTQLFLTFRGKPIFGSLRIAIERKWNGFNPENPHYDTLEAIIQKLINGIHYLPSDLLNEIAHGKWESPMIAILGAYTYLLGDQKDSYNLFEIIISNLENRILQDNMATDVTALKMLFAIRRGKNVPNITVSNPCMLAAGMRTLIDASYQGFDTIRGNSIAEQIIKQQFSDLIWTSYIPLPYAPKSGRFGNVRTRGRSGSDATVEAPESIEQTGDVWIGLSLMNKLNMEANFMEKGLLSEDHLSDPVRIAKALNITPKVLNDVVDKLIEKRDFFKNYDHKSLKNLKGFDVNTPYDEKAYDMLNKLLKK